VFLQGYMTFSVLPGRIRLNIASHSPWFNFALRRRLPARNPSTRCQPPRLLTELNVLCTDRRGNPRTKFYAWGSRVSLSWNARCARCARCANPVDNISRDRPQLPMLCGVCPPIRSVVVIDRPASIRAPSWHHRICPWRTKYFSDGKQSVFGCAVSVSPTVEVPGDGNHLLSQGGTSHPQCT